MEPQLPKPQFNPEATPSVQPVVHGGEVFIAPRTSELAVPIEQGRETHEIATDGPKGDPSAVQPFSPPPMPTVGPVQTTAGALTTDDANPVAASDDDLIEKEWVEKAKQVVAETRNDPHAQDLAVSKLQADYLKKRYGKVIAVPKEE